MWVSAANESSNSYSVEPVDILQFTAYPYLDDNFIIFHWCSNQMTIFYQHW